MLKLLKNNYKRTNDCIILAVPLILFFSVISWYCRFAQNYADGIIQVLFAIVTLVVMCGGCSAIWLYMVKKAIKLSGMIYVFDRDRINGLKELIKAVPKGLGKLFIPMILVNVSVFILLFLIVFIANYLSTKYIFPIDFDFIFGDDFFVSSAGLADKINELPDEMLVSLNFFFITVHFLMVVFSFLLMLWIPEIVYTYKNPIEALYCSLKKLFSKFWKSLALFVIISVMYFILTILNTLLMMNLYFYFFVLVFSYYFLIYVVVLIFSYYEQEFQN